MPIHALWKPPARDGAETLGVLDRCVYRGSAQLLEVCHEPRFIPWRFRTLPFAHAEVPAVTFNRQQQRTSVILWHLAEGHHTLPVAGRLCRDSEHGTGIGEIHANSRLLGERLAERLEQVHRERTSP